MTRDAADAALLMDVVTGADARDWSQLAPLPEGSGFLAALTGSAAGLAGLRVAYSPDLGGQVPVRAAVADAVRRAVERMAELGALVEEADPEMGEAHRADPEAAFQTLWFSGAARVVQHLTPAERELLDPGLREVCEQGARLSALDYLAAVDARMELGRLMGRFHERYDLLVTPTLPLTAFEAGEEVPRGSKLARWTGWTPFTYPFNLTQQPAATVPVGTDGDGLPVGLQIVGPRHGDAVVLRAAHVLYEAEVAGIAPPPPPAAGATPGGT
jgi:aspartyl-tRNA(Asn)/glutamyl-tRNA(Gln) amidotransferase subunit A